MNGRAWSAKILRDAVKNATTNSTPIELLVQFNDYYKTYSLDYHGGEKYPVLDRSPEALLRLGRRRPVAADLVRRR